MTLPEKYEIYLEEIRKALLNLIKEYLVKSDEDINEKIYSVINEKEKQFRGTKDNKLNKTSWMDLDISRVVTVITNEDNHNTINQKIYIEDYVVTKLKRVRNYVAHDKAKKISYEDQIQYWKILLQASKVLKMEPITECIQKELDGTIKRSEDEDIIKEQLIELLETKVMKPAYEASYNNNEEGELIREKLNHTREYLSSAKTIDEVHDFYWNSLKNPSGIETYDAIKAQGGCTFEDCRKEFMDIYGETLPKKLKFV